MLERVVLGGPVAFLHFIDLRPDRQHRLDKAVQLSLDSLSVGSTIKVPGTGKDMVGAWKP